MLQSGSRPPDENTVLRLPQYCTVNSLMGLQVCLFVLLISASIPILRAARSTDELDGGFVITEETHDAPYHHSHNYAAADAVRAVSTVAEGRRAGEVYDTTVRYLGCYYYWSGHGHLDASVVREEYHESMTPWDCVNECWNRYTDGQYEVAMLQGHLCRCVHWSYFNKTRILDDYCNFQCPGDEPTDDTDEQVTSKLDCGGNLAVSVYCNMAWDPTCATGSTAEDQPGMIDQYPLPTLTAMEASVERSYIGCGACNRESSSVIGKCRKSDAYIPPNDYFPLNSPAACIQSCRRNLTSWGYDNEPYRVSALGYMYDNGRRPNPICMCRSDDPFEEAFLLVSEDNCDAQCPGNSEAYCGNATTTYIFSFYCTHESPNGNCTKPMFNPTLPDEPVPEEEDEWGSTSTTTSDTEPSTHTVSPFSTTGTSLSTGPASTTVEPRSTVASETTLRSTEPVEITLPTTTSEVTVSSKTTTATTTPRPEDCKVICIKEDHYSLTWKACAGMTARIRCPGEAHGHATWRCLNNGSFATDVPDYSNCSSSWFDDILNRFNSSFDENGTIPIKESKSIFEELEKRLLPASNNSVPYYGHEIRNITKITWRVVNATKVTNLKEHREIVQRAMTVPGILLANQKAWKDISNATLRGETGYELLQSIERSVFTLKSSVNSSSDVILEDFAAPNINLIDFQATFGAGTKNRSLQDQLQFPVRSLTGSYITLEKGWEDGLNEPAFVGILLDAAYISDIMPTNLNGIQNKPHHPPSTAKKMLNSKMISLTLGHSDAEVGQVWSGDHQVMITFRHYIEAYGTVSEDVRRKLHPGEGPKAVKGSAACVYWSAEKSVWSTDGCWVYESTPYKTVCKCSHLTSFALIMDIHNYVGKDYALEILTFILCPLSVVALLICIIVFSSVAAIHSQRTTITKHLCACLLLGIILILFAADRNYFHLPEGVCTAVGIITHYIYLAAFVWMGIEGIHLYKMVVCVFDSGRSPTTMYRITAYGIPVLIVGITCVVGYLQEDQPYGSDLYCWLVGVYHWGFIGPIAAIVMLNLIILCLALKTAHQMSPSSSQIVAKRRSYKTWIRGSFSITVLLGITWLPGFFVLTSFASFARVSAYIFVLLNASQGVFLFVFHCLLNEKVRAAAGRKMSLPTWLAVSQTSKEVTQSGRRSENVRTVFAHTGAGIAGHHDSKMEKDSWSMFRSDNIQQHDGGPSAHSRTAVQGPGGRMLRQSSSSSSAGSQKALVDGGRW